MPQIAYLSRPMVDILSLRITPHVYKIKLLNVKELDTGIQSVLLNYEFDRNIVQIEIRPMDMGHLIIFAAPGPAGRAAPYISLFSLIDIKATTQIKGILKRKDLLLEIIFVGNENKRYVATIDIEDKYIDEVIGTVKKFRLLESDSYFWAFRSLTTGNPTKVINVYPNAPFLSDGEELIWKNSRTYQDNYKDKIQSIDVITNYRVFHYDYSVHKGAGILLPLLEDTKVTNTRTKRNKNVIGSYSIISSHFLEGIEEIINPKLLGDITFFSEGKPLFSFLQITDPLTLLASIDSLKEQIKNSEVGYGIPLSKDEKRTSSTLTCARCGSSDNSSISKFCGQCGNPLSTVCSKCRESNPAGTKFCGHCGANL